MPTPPVLTGLITGLLLGALVIGHPRLLDAAAIGGALVLAGYGLAALRRALHPGALQAAEAGTKQTLSISLLNPHVDLDTVVLVGAVGARQTAGTQGAFLLGASLASVLWFALLV